MSYKKRGLSFSNKATLWTVGISAVTLIFAIIIPNVKKAYDHFSQTQVKIISPANYTKVANNAFAVNGTAQHIPAGWTLWLIIESGVESRWYPILPLVLHGSRWNVPSGNTCTSHGAQEVEIWMVPDADGTPLYAHRNSAEGISSTPAGAKLEAQIHIYVPQHAADSC